MDPLAKLRAEDVPEPPVAKDGAAPVVEPQQSAGFLGRLKRLFMPYPRRPEEFADDVVALGVNGLLDRATGHTGLAGEKLVGQSVALCWNALGFESMLGYPPIGHLVVNGGRYALAVRRAKLGKVVAESRVGAPGT